MSSFLVVYTLTSLAFGLLNSVEPTKWIANRQANACKTPQPPVYRCAEAIFGQAFR